MHCEAAYVLLVGEAAGLSETLHGRHHALREDRPPRIISLTGGPGTGKTEVLLEAVRRSLDDGCKVLLAGPIGMLIASHRTRLNLTIETIHAAFKITRERDQEYSLRVGFVTTTSSSWTR